MDGQHSARFRRLCTPLLFLLCCGSGVLAQTLVRFAVVGDYGDNPPHSGKVAALIQSWHPDLVVTTGDNNYTNPTPDPPNHYPSWDAAVGQYYHTFIAYPAGSGSALAASGSAANRFFPSLGNHDWSAGIAGWNSYFHLPGNERYYDFVRGPVHFLAIDSDSREPDGNTSGSTQARWLQNRLSASASPWKIVYFHHPPYTSATRGNNTALQWPFQAWGASAVLNGHEHHYERILKNGFPYLVCGAGGWALNNFSGVEPGSVVRYDADHGALLVEASTDSIVFRFYSVAGGAGGTLIDRYVLYSLVPLPVQLASFVATVRGDGIRLEWTTLSETNNFGFYLQRRGLNETEFTELPGSFVAGHGTTVVPRTYSYLDTSGSGSRWWYRLKQVDFDGSVHFSEPTQAGAVAGVADLGRTGYALAQNYPNPFNPSTTIRYELGGSSMVRLSVYDMLGREVSVLVNASKDAGTHEVQFDGSGLPSGAYFYRLQAGSYVERRRLLLVR